MTFNNLSPIMQQTFGCRVRSWPGSFGTTWILLYQTALSSPGAHKMYATGSGGGRGEGRERELRHHEWRGEVK